MKEGQYKQMENKIKEAADNLQPDFNEEAWNRMELLLDKEKGKRPVFWWWFLGSFLLIAPIVIYQMMPPQTSPNMSYKETEKEQPVTTQKANDTDSGVTLSIKTQIPDTNKYLAVKSNIAPGNTKTILGINKPFNQSDHNNTNHFTSPKNIHLGNKFGEKHEEKRQSVTIGLTDKVASEKGEKKEDKDNTLAKTADTNEKQIKEEIIKKNSETQKVNSFFSKIYITANTGLDASGFKLFSSSDKTLALKSGIGLGYQLNKKFNVETGFYVGSKNYIAGPKDYKYGPGSYWSTVDLIKVDANCFVYEIPLLLQYTFSQKPTTRYYAGAGLVSFIMKKEDYKYDYTRYGSEQTSAKTYQGNSHLFSSFQFSIGVEKKLSEKLSILATPSISLPMQGIGNGKVKLYSTSLQVGAKYFPFKNNK